MDVKTRQMSNLLFRLFEIALELPKYTLYMQHILDGLKLNATVIILPYGNQINTHTNKRGEFERENTHTRCETRKSIIKTSHHIKLKINLSDKVKRCFANDLMRLMNFSQDKEYTSACGNESRHKMISKPRKKLLQNCAWYSNQSKKKHSHRATSIWFFSFVTFCGGGQRAVTTTLTMTTATIQ